MMALPVLSFTQKAGQGCPALAVLAAAKLAGVELQLKPLDAKDAKDVTLTFPGGCVPPCRCQRRLPFPQARPGPHSRP